MEMVLIAIRFIWAIEEMRMPIVLVGIMFVLGLCVSVWSVHIPTKSLYKPCPGESVSRLSFNSLLRHFQENPRQWLFYETEIYHISKDIEDMTAEEKALLRKALGRMEDGGPYAKKLGKRVILKNASEGRKYLHFIERKASCPGST